MGWTATMLSTRIASIDGWNAGHRALHAGQMLAIARMQWKATSFRLDFWYSAAFYACNYAINLSSTLGRNQQWQIARRYLVLQLPMIARHLYNVLCGAGKKVLFVVRHLSFCAFLCILCILYTYFVHLYNIVHFFTPSYPPSHSLICLYADLFKSQKRFFRPLNSSFRKRCSRLPPSLVANLVNAPPPINFLYEFSNI